MKTILCVDDSESHRFLLREELSEEGYTVVTVSSNEEVFSKYGEFCPDLIIAGRTGDVRRRQAIHQQTDLIAETGERSVPSAHDRATMQTATTRRAGREDTR